MLNIWSTILDPPSWIWKFCFQIWIQHPEKPWDTYLYKNTTIFKLLICHIGSTILNLEFTYVIFWFSDPKKLRILILIKPGWYQIISLSGSENWFQLWQKGFGYDKKHTFSNVIKHRHGIKQFLGESLQYTKTFLWYYGRNIKTNFYTKSKWLRLWHGIFTRDKIMISIIHCKQTFTLHKTNTARR